MIETVLLDAALRVAHRRFRGSHDAPKSWVTGSCFLAPKVSSAPADETSMGCRRCEPRFKSDQPVAVTNLEQPGRLLSGRLINFSANGIRMLLKCGMRLGSTVKVEWGGTVLLGEIIYCTPQGTAYVVGLELEDAVYRTEMPGSLSESCAAPAR